MSAANAQNSAPPPTTKVLAPGDMVDERYRIEAYLGGGGMASVYRATHVVLEQAVAIKVISPQIRALPGMAQRFLREARAATHLKSEHVARVSDVGTMPDGGPYMVMEFLDGRDLDAVLESEEGIAVEDAVDYVLQACEALAEVHGLGIVHRDLKPANLFLTRGADGLPCVKLIDFGISRTDSPLAERDLVSLTQPDTVMGSPRYMSPEQMESSKKADCRSDIYGIGAVLYEMLTRKAPHEGDTFLDIYAAVTLGPPAPPSSLRSDVPSDLDEVILRCLRVEPDERYVDAADLAAALAPFGPEGSLARADAIARILESARARTQNGGAPEELGAAGVEISHARRRVSSSAHAVRKRRFRRGALAVTLLGLVVLGGGARALYPQALANVLAGSEPANTTPTETTNAVTAPAAMTAAAALAPAPAAAPVAASAAAPILAPPPNGSPTSVTTIAAATLEPAAARPRPATAAPSFAAAVPARTASPAPAPEPSTFEPPAAAAAPPPRANPTPARTQAQSSTSDERTLFEDRK